MKRLLFVAVLFCTLMITACSVQENHEAVVSDEVKTQQQFPVFTPTATLLPGIEIIPISEMGDSVPWQPLGDDVPYVLFYGFNVNNPPFDDVLVRKAFAAAVDREAIIKIAINNRWENLSPATTFLPPSILGRDLYNAVGVPFDPDYARELLSKAGYSDPSQFPSVTLSSNTISNNTPGFADIANALIDMWMENLGVNVEFKQFMGVDSYYLSIFNEPENVYIYKGMYGPSAEDGLDPQFLSKFSSKSELNFSHYKSDRFDFLLDKGLSASSPESRQRYYIEAERLLCEEDVVIIPIFHTSLPQ